MQTFVHEVVNFWVRLPLILLRISHIAATTTGILFFKVKQTEIINFSSTDLECDSYSFSAHSSPHSPPSGFFAKNWFRHLHLLVGPFILFIFLFLCVISFHFLKVGVMPKNSGAFGILWRYFQSAYPGTVLGVVCRGARPPSLFHNWIERQALRSFLDLKKCPRIVDFIFKSLMLLRPTGKSKWASKDLVRTEPLWKPVLQPHPLLWWCALPPSSGAVGCDGFTAVSLTGYCPRPREIASPKVGPLQGGAQANDCLMRGHNGPTFSPPFGAPLPSRLQCSLWDIFRLRWNHIVGHLLPPTPAALTSLQVHLRGTTFTPKNHLHEVLRHRECF